MKIEWGDGDITFSAEATPGDLTALSHTYDTIGDFKVYVTVAEAGNVAPQKKFFTVR